MISLFFLLLSPILAATQLFTNPDPPFIRIDKTAVGISGFDIMMASLGKRTKRHSPLADEFSKTTGIKRCAEGTGYFNGRKCPPKDHCIREKVVLIPQSQKELCTDSLYCKEEGHVFDTDCLCYPAPAECKKLKSHAEEDFECSVSPTPVNLTVHRAAWEGMARPCETVGLWEWEKCTDTVEQSELLQWAIVGDAVYIGGALNIEQALDTKSEQNYVCTGTATGGICGVKECIQRKDCDGDKSFKDNFQAQSGSACRCRLEGRVFTSYLVKRETGTRKRVSCFGVGSWNQRRAKGKALTKRSAPECKQCTITCTNSGIVLVSPHRQIVTAVVCKNPYCVTSVVNGKEAEMVFKAEMLANSGEVNVEMWMDGHQQPYRTTVECKGFDFCLSYNNWYEFGLLLQPHCWQKTNTTTVIGTCLASIGIMVLFSALVSLLWLARLVVKPMVLLGRLLAKFCWARLRSKEKTGPEDLELGLIGRKASWTNRGMERKFARPLLLLIMVFGFPAVQGDFFEALKVASEECTSPSPGVTFCTVSFDSKLSVSPVGQTSTFKLEGKDGSDFGLIKVKTLSIKLTCLPELQYYTFHGKPAGAHKSKCQWSENCNEESCAHYPSQNGPLHEHSAKILSKRECRWLTARAWCLSGLVAGSECFWLWHLVERTSEVCSVHTCPEWTRTVTVEITEVSSNRSRTETVSLRPTEKKKLWHGLEIETEAIGLNPNSDLNECVVKCGEEVSMLPCNKKDEFTAGRIGEVQCPSYNSAILTTPECRTTSRYFEATVRTHSREVDFKLNQVNITNLAKRHLLPLHRQGIAYLPNDNHLVTASITSAGSMSLYVRSGKWQLVPISKEVECWASFKSLEGCYQCAGGAKVTIEGSTAWGEATAVVECEKFSMPVWLNNTKREHTFFAHFNESHVDQSCNLTCPKSKTKVEIKGTLLYIPPAAPDDGVSETSVDKSAATLGIPSFGSVFSKIMNAIIRIIEHGWLELAIILGSLALLALIAGLVYIKVYSSFIKKIT